MLILRELHDVMYQVLQLQVRDAVITEILQETAATGYLFRKTGTTKHTTEFVI